MSVRESIALPKPIKVYPKVTKRNVQALFDDCMKVKGGRIAWLIETAGILGIDKSKLDFTPDSLVVLWEGLMGQIRHLSPPPVTVDDIYNCPEWFGHNPVGVYNNKQGYDLFSIWLLDGLMYYYGETLIRNAPIPIAWQNQDQPQAWSEFGLPIIYAVDASNSEYGAFWCSSFHYAIGALFTMEEGGKPNPERMKNAYYQEIKLIASGHYRKRPPELEPNIAAPLPEAFEFGIEQNDDDADYPYHVWFFEGTEYELGIKTFNSLRKRFAAIDGVKKVIHEDREVFLIKSDLAIETLKERIWATFCQACAEVVANKQAQAEARAAKRAAAKAAKLAKQ